MKWGEQGHVIWFWAAVIVGVWTWLLISALLAEGVWPGALLAP